MSTLSPDTHPDAERVQIALLRRADSAAHFRLVRSLSRTAMGLARRAARRRAVPSTSPEPGGTMDADLLLALTPVVEALERVGANCRIGGSVASSIHGVPRTTLDVDLVADLHPDHAFPLVEQLREAYYIDLDRVRDAIARRAAFNVIHLATMIKVDVFVLSDRPFDRAAFDRAVEDTLEPGADARPFHVTSAEDIVLHKLAWFRLGGEVSERQWRDAVGVIKVRAGDLDLDHMRRWAADLGVADLLERALTEAGD